MNNNEFLDSVIGNNAVQPAFPPKQGKSATTENALTNKNALEEKALGRDEDLKDHFHQWFKRVLSAMCVLFIVIVAVLILHWILPAKWTWLDDKQLDNLKNIALAVFASNAISTWVNKIR